MKTLPALFLTAAVVSPVSMARAQTVADKVESAMQSATTGLYDLIDKDITTVNFPKGGYALSEAEVRNIRAVYKSVLADTNVGQVIVAAWSDREGIKADVKLPESQVVLAQKRAEAIKRILNDMSSKPVESYNMAQDASWIATTFRTKDAKLKEAVKSPAADSYSAGELASTLESKGGPGTAVLIVKRSTAENSTTGR